jgi:hypothetical protein
MALYSTSPGPDISQSPPSVSNRNAAAGTMHASHADHIHSSPGGSLIKVQTKVQRQQYNFCSRLWNQQCARVGTKWMDSG